MKQDLALAFFLLISVTIVQAQTEEKSNQTRDSFESLVKLGADNSIVYNNTYAGVKGSPFLFDHWITGELVLIKDSRFSDVKMKYDMVEDNVLVQNNSGKSIYPIKAIVKSFHLKDSLGHTYNYINLALAEYSSDFIKNFGFVEILYDGTNDLIAKRKKHLVHIDAKGGYSENKSYDEFRNSPSEYYWINKEGIATQLKRGKNNILKVLDENGDLASYVKKEKLNLKKEEDIILLFAYIDSN
jgi:hypothetical protein